MGQTADLDTALDSTRLGAFQTWVLLLCGLVAVADGFDTQVIGLVAPAIAAEWRIAPPLFGPVFASGLFSGMIGALALGQAADRWGRKPVLLGAILLFGLGSLATALTNSVLGLGAVRLLTGFGLGGAIPIIIAIANEVAPRRIRTNVVAFMFCGFPLGSAVGGLIAAQVIPAWGWRSVFYLGGAVPLALVPLFAALTPESVRYLAARGRTAEAHRVLQRMGCAIGWNGLSPPVAAATRPSLANLFRAGRAVRTIRIWSTLFSSLLLTVFLVNWLPLLVRQSGLSLRTAVLTVTALNLGGILGGFAIGRVCDRLASIKPIAAAYAAGGVVVALIGLAGRSDGLLMAATFVAGVLTVGAQMTAIALSAQLYETSLRTTGVGWAFGVGRIGAVVGPVLGGLLIAAHVPTRLLFLFGGLTAGLAALAVVGIVLPAAARAPVEDAA